MHHALKNTAPQLGANEAPRGFGWVDALVLLALLGLLWSALHFGKGMLVHFDATHAAPAVDVSPSQIPYYAGRTLLRMWIAFAFSLCFAIGVGYVAAKSRAARAVILPALDVLQSVPVLGFLSATVAGFMAVVSRGGIDGLLQKIHPFDVFPIRRRLRVTREDPV